MAGSRKHVESAARQKGVRARPDVTGRRRPLERFPILRTRDADEVRTWLAPSFAVRDMEIGKRGRSLDCVVNHCSLPATALTYLRYGSPINLRLEQNDFFVQGFPLSGSGEVKWNRALTLVGPGIGVGGGPGSRATIAYDDKFSHLVLKISPAAVTRRLSLLLDAPVDPPLELTGYVTRDKAAAHFRLVRFLAEEVGREQDRLPDVVLAELEDAVVVNYLLANEHNYSWRLLRAPRAAAPSQVKRAIDYMEHHWDQALTIEALTEVTGASARSLFHLFRKSHGVSPMVYLRRVRLQHAREMLCRGDSKASVTTVGFACGFSNLGHFASKYYAAFGEKPSETLKNHRR